MSFFEYIAAVETYRANGPFPSLYELKRRVGGILVRRTPEELENGALEIMSSITELKERRVNDAVDRLARRLCEEGGWETEFLPDGLDGTEDEYRALLLDWPSGSDRPGIPTVDNVMSDLDALEDVLSDIDSTHAVPGFPNALQAELFAVLALVKLDDAARALRRDELQLVEGMSIARAAPPPNLHKVIEGAKALIEATELVCYAERELTEMERRSFRDELRKQWDDEIRVDALKSNARLGGLAKHAATNQAKGFVAAEWATHRADYGNNKSAFSRDYVRRVKNELNVQVTEKQMREVWLSDTPPASKPVRLPAGG